MKRKINQGVFIFFPFPLNNIIENIERGIIHSALANFTVVAIFSASLP